MKRTFWVLVAVVLATFVLTTSTAEAARSITIVDIGGDVGQYSSLALDADSNPVVSYYDATNGDLQVLHCHNGACGPWMFQGKVFSPDTGGDVGRHTSLALDASGNPVVSYYDATNGNLKVVHCNDPDCDPDVNGGEAPTSPDGAGADVGQYTSLALDASGNPVVSYYDASNKDLKVLHCGNDDCSQANTITTVDTGGDVGQYTSLRLEPDPSWKPVVSYYDVTNGNLKVLHCGNTDCTAGNTITSPDTTGIVGAYTSLRLDGTGKPVVSYYDVSNGDLKVVHCGDANCSAGNTVTRPDAAGDVGAYTSLALASGKPVVSYYDAYNGDMKMLFCGDANCGAGNYIRPWPHWWGAWGSHTSLTLDGSGYAVVSLYDASHGDLNVIKCLDATCAADTPWQIRVSVGHSPSLALDSQGRPVVSYYDWTDGYDPTNGKLKVLHCGNASCTSGNSITSPDTVGDIYYFDDAWTSLALDTAGKPVVSYYDYTNHELKVMHCNDVNCAGNNETITSPDTEDGVGRHASLALDTPGNPVISYYGYLNHDLKVMHCNDVYCADNDESITSPDPDTDHDLGWHTSLVLDTAGKPVISYWDNTGKELKVLHCNDVKCDPVDGGPETPTVVDTAENAGIRDTSLRLDGAGNPVVSYYDYTNGKLKVLHCGNANCTLGNTINMPDQLPGTHGWGTSLRLADNWFPVVSYGHSSGGALRVLRCNDPDCEGGDESIVAADSWGGYQMGSLALNSSGNPVVSYGDMFDNLRVLHCDTPTCAVPAYPPAGTDTLPVSLTSQHLYLDENEDGVPEFDAGAVTFSGTGKFQRGTPYVSGGYKTIDTEIRSMVLTANVRGYAVTLKAGVEQGLSASYGKIREQAAGSLFPADTWFDLFFQVDSADPKYGVMRNCDFGQGAQSVHYQGVTMSIPAVNVQYQIPSCPVEPPPASCAIACRVGAGLVGGEAVPMSAPPGSMGVRLDNPAGGGGALSVGGIAEWPGTAAGSDSSADSSGGSGFNYTALGAALGAGVLALAAGAWFARRRWAR